MFMHDYNIHGEKVVLLLHPMLASGSLMYDLLGRHLGDNVRCLAPDFGSHGQERSCEFKNASLEADAIIDYLSKHGIKHIDLAYGASMGGVVLTELLKRNLDFSAAFFEGTSFFNNARILTKVLSIVFIRKHRRALSDYQRAIHAMSELYGNDYAVEFADQFIAMSENSIYNIAQSCGNNKPANLPPALQKRCTFAYGSKDPNLIKAKKGCKTSYPYANFIIWDGFDHCEKITSDTTSYINMLSKLI